MFGDFASGCPPKTTQPVIKIIDDDEDNVGSFIFSPRCDRCGKDARSDQEASENKWRLIHG